MMNPHAIEVFDVALERISEEASRPSLKAFPYYSETRIAFRNVVKAVERAHRVIRAVKADPFSFLLGANSPFTRYVRANVDDFNVPEPKVYRRKHRNGIRFYRKAYLEAATAAVQFALDHLAVARCFLAAAQYPVAVVVVRIQFDDGWHARDAPIEDSFNLIDDAVSCAELDNFIRASVRVFDDHDLSDVIKIVGNDLSYIHQPPDVILDAALNQCRANLLKLCLDT